MPVAVAVVSFNTRDLLRACLASLAPEVEAGRARVWVVDAGSADGSPALVRDEFAWAELLERPDNPGFGAAVNLVAERAGDCAWIAPANADVALEPGALEALLAAGGRDPGAGAVAPRLLLPDGTTQHSVLPFPTLRFTIRFNLTWRRGGRWAEAMCVPGAWDPGRPRRVPWAVGAFLLVRRAAWDEVGGFDPAQWLYAEDLDLGWRLARAGWATRYEPSARVRHAESASTGPAFGAGQDARRMAATYAWIARRRGPLIARSVALVNVLGATARRIGSRGRDPAHAHWARLHAIGLRRSAARRR